MEKELSTSLEGMVNINDVTNFSLKMEFLRQSVQHHKELRELCRQEFIRRMQNVMLRRRKLLEKRQIRQKLVDVGDKTDVVQQENKASHVSEITISKLDYGNDNLPKKRSDFTDATDSHRKKVEFKSPVSPKHTRYRRRGSIGNSKDGNKVSGKGRRNFRRISLAVGGAVRISSRRRHTFPAESELHVRSSPTRAGGRAQITPERNFKGEERSMKMQHEPHLAITRQSLNTTAHHKVRGMMTRMKVIKSFQGK